MHSRISLNRLNTAPLHAKDTLWVLAFIRDVMRLIDGELKQLDPLRLDEWTDVRGRLTECKEPIMEYGANYWLNRGEMDEHRDLIFAIDAIIVELKLRNMDNGQRDILPSEVDTIRTMLNSLDRCRKKLVFY